MAAGLSAFSVAPDLSCSVPGDLAAPAQSITIRAAASAPAGSTFCFEVVSYTGIPAVSFEINEVFVPVTISTSADGATIICCARIPNGCAGSTATITAVGPGGQVATTTVTIT